MDASAPVKPATERPETEAMLAAARRTLRRTWIGGTLMFVAFVMCATTITAGKHPAGLATGITTLLAGGSLGLLLIVGPIARHVYTRAKRVLSHADWEVWHCEVNGRLLKLSREEGATPELAVRFSPWFARKYASAQARQDGVVWLARVSGQRQVVIAPPGPKPTSLGEIVAL